MVQTRTWVFVEHRCTLVHSYWKSAAIPSKLTLGPSEWCFMRCSSASPLFIATKWKIWSPRLTMDATKSASLNQWQSKPACSLCSVYRWMRMTDCQLNSFTNILSSLNNWCKILWRLWMWMHSTRIWQMQLNRCLTCRLRASHWWRTDLKKVRSKKQMSSSPLRQVTKSEVY